MTNWLSPRLIYPLLHAAIGWGFLLGTFLRVLPLGAFYFRAGLVIFGVVIFVKESWWDPTHEPGQPFVWEGVIDLASYGAGLLLGAITIAA